MYHLAIVDDEDIIRRGLTTVVDWEALGFSVVGAFQSAEETLRVVPETPVDVVLVDIRLPRRSGLELIHSLRESSPTARFVILSGYDSFQYAQKAIDLDVFAYLLKPVKTDEVIDVFSRLRAVLDRDFASRNRQIVGHQEQVVKGLSEKRPADTWTSHWDSLVRRHSWLQRPGWYLVIVDIHIDIQLVEHRSLTSSTDTIRWNCIEELSEGLALSDRVVLGASAEGRLFLCIKNRNSLAAGEATIADGIARVSDDYVSVAFSAAAIPARAGSAEGLLTAATEAERRIETRLSHGINHILLGTAEPCAVGVSEFDCTLFAAECALRFVQDDETGLRSGIDALIGAVSDSCSNDMEALRVQLVRFFYEMEEQMKPYSVSLRACGAKVEDFINTVLIYPSFDEIKTRLVSVLLPALASYRRIHDRPHNHVVSAALDIITRRFGTDLTLESVAEEIQVSPSHLSRLFRHVLNETFKEHLTKLRISEARRRLVDTNDKVYQIAEAVGFSDQRYFSEVFRKHTGMSPVQYRNRRGNG